MGLTSIGKKCEKLKRARSSPNNALFLKQNHQLYGFIPLNGIPSTINGRTHYHVMEPLEAHQLLKNEKIPNYLGLRIPVASDINVDLWEQLLQGYWDTQLPQFLRYGLPLCIDENHSLVPEKINHHSALEFPEDVKAYLNEEIAEKAILGPFQEPPEGIHTFPFMTREEPGAKHRRVIIDLSWPMGTSVSAGVPNDTYGGAEFILTFPSIDNITNRVIECG